MKKIVFLGGKLEKISLKFTGYFRKNVGFQVKSGLFPGLIGVKWGQYATYFHLGPIKGLYEDDMLVIYHDFEGNLPFTGILQEFYGLPYATSTAFSNALRALGQS